MRAVAPDANPYLMLYSVFRTGLEGTTLTIEGLRQAERYLPDNVQTAIEDFRASDGSAPSWAKSEGRFADLKLTAADRAPRELGTIVKTVEVQYHHEVYNQSLWNLF